MFFPARYAMRIMYESSSAAFLKMMFVGIKVFTCLEFVAMHQRISSWDIQIRSRSIELMAREMNSLTGSSLAHAS